jgi:hypothetical protein
MTKFYIAVSFAGYWGRGMTVGEARKAMQHEGGKIAQGGVLLLVEQPVGMPEPYVNRYGNVVHADAGSATVIDEWKRRTSK